MPFGYGGGGFRGDPRGGAQGGYGGEGAAFGDIFEGLFGGPGGGGGGPFGGFGGRGAPPQKGANVAYRLAVTSFDAPTPAMPRIPLHIVRASSRERVCQSVSNPGGGVASQRKIMT